jgi:hypothetical protein
MKTSPVGNAQIFYLILKSIPYCNNYQRDCDFVDTFLHPGSLEFTRNINLASGKYET